MAFDQFKVGRPRAARPRSAPIVRTTRSILQNGSCIGVLPNVPCRNVAANRCALSSLFATYVAFASSVEELLYILFNFCGGLWGVKVHRSFGDFGAGMLKFNLFRTTVLHRQMDQSLQAGAAE